MKNNKGITLISLVLTIIILIILAGVSVNLVVGQDGIISKAKQAKENIELAQIEEQQRLNELYEEMENGVSGSASYESVSELVSKFETIKSQYESLQSEYANFKTRIATAITNKGITTSATDSAQTMETNISNISSVSESGMDLLWENPNPTSTFAAQTISLDLSEYEGVMVEYANSNVYKSCATMSFQGWCLNTCSGGTKYRSYVPNATGVTFSAGASHTIWDQGTTDNNSTIPYRIYGISVMPE